MKLTRKQILILIILRRRRRRRKKEVKRSQRFWIRPIFANRKSKSEFHCLVQEMKLGDHELFFKQFRMLPAKLEKLLRLVAPKISKSSAKRESISAEERLCVTLRFLASGDSQSTISGSYRISRSSISRIVRETTQALWDVLLEEGFLDAPKMIGEKWPLNLKNNGTFLIVWVRLMGNMLKCKHLTTADHSFLIIRKHLA